MNLAAILQIVQKVLTIIALVYIYQLDKFGDSISCASKDAEVTLKSINFDFSISYSGIYNFFTLFDNFHRKGEIHCKLYIWFKIKS